MSEDKVNKDVCNEKHNTVDDKFVDLKANIHTSKESLSNRLDEVDTALLGDRKAPGGLLRDIIEIKKDVDRATEDIEKYEKDVDNKIQIQNFRIKICIGLIVILIGGKFFGFGFNTVKDYFAPPKTIPITAPAPVEEENDTIPKEIRDYIKEQLKNNEHNNGHVDISKENLKYFNESQLEKEKHEDEHRDISMEKAKELISSTEEKQ